MATKVLVLEGGGYFGLINTTFLTYLGDNYDVCRHIDSISGCSIGGIEACALMSGFTGPREMQEGFIKHGKEIFTKRDPIAYPLSIPWYSDEGLKKTLTQFVSGQKTIGDTRKTYPNTSLFVPVLNLSKNKLKVYDNVDGQDDGALLLHVCLETSAACFYFPIRYYNGDAIIDGGLREVCPVLTHTTGLKKHCGVDFADMDVLVLGAGRDATKLVGDYGEVSKWGVTDWLTKFIIKDVTGSNESTSKFWGSQMGFRSFEWFNPVMTFGAMDDVSQTEYILESCEMYKELFLDKWEQFMKGE